MEAPLRLSGEQMRTLGYRAVDEVIEHMTTLHTKPVGRPHDRETLEEGLNTPIPEGPTPPEEVLDQVMQQVLDAIVHTDHPRFFAYIPGPSTFTGALGDFLASGFNVFAGHWLVGAGPAVVEHVTIDWLRKLCGLPDTAGGLFVSGGTMATLTAMHAARIDRLTSPNAADATIYVTTHTHAAIRSRLGFLGFAEHQIRTVPVDTHHRMDPVALATLITGDYRSGRKPFCVLATAGTTNTGAVDPLDDIADVCQRHGLWLHVDGAYGAAAILTEEAKNLLSGLARADSIALDPHKWWFQPWESGCVLVRETQTLTNAYRLHAEYLNETRHGQGPINYYDYGPQLTRNFRALKLWMTLRIFGLDAFRRAIAHGIALAEHAQTVLTARPHWRIVTPAQLGIITFRPYTPDLSDADLDALACRAFFGPLIWWFPMLRRVHSGSRCGLHGVSGSRVPNEFVSYCRRVRCSVQ